MEAFSLLKYWRGGTGAVFNRRTTSNLSSSSSATTTILTAVTHSSSDSDSDSDPGDDDGPFFDLEFTLPQETRDHVDNDSDSENEPEGNVDDKARNDEEEGEEIKFTLSSSSSGDSNDPNVTLSPSDALFFKGRVIPIDSSSGNLNSSEAPPKFPPVSSILKSATKFRVQMSKFNKPKSNSRKNPEKSEPQGKIERKQQNTSRFLTVKLKVEEVPLVTFFTRENSSKGKNTKSVERNANNDVVFEDTNSNGSADERKFSKDVMQKYLKKVKPLYVRVSKRYGDKLRFSGQLSFPRMAAEQKSPTEKSTAAEGEGGEAVAGEVTGGINNIGKGSQKQGNLQAGLRVVCKHLGKSRSASSSVVTAAAAPVVSKRRDDSLLQQQDGIQSAILHCKRSFNASRDLEASILSRSVSDPSHEKLSCPCSGKARGTCN